MSIDQELVSVSVSFDFHETARAAAGLKVMPLMWDKVSSGH